MTVEALCQDCLRVRVYPDYNTANFAVCECGGDMCPCGFCAWGIAELRAGRDGGCAEFPHGWSAEYGAPDDQFDRWEGEGGALLPENWIAVRQLDSFLRNERLTDEQYLASRSALRGRT